MLTPKEARAILCKLSESEDYVSHCFSVLGTGAKIYLDPEGNGHPMTAKNAVAALDAVANTAEQFGTTITGVTFRRHE